MIKQCEKSEDPKLMKDIQMEIDVVT
jgi:hypothetical protein